MFFHRLFFYKNAPLLSGRTKDTPQTSPFGLPVSFDYATDLPENQEQVMTKK
jgi:hypothetical protein